MMRKIRKNSQRQRRIRSHLRRQLKSQLKSLQKSRRRGHRRWKERIKKRRLSYFCAPRSHRAGKSQKGRWRS
jgi:hypothetical protein